MLPRNDNWNGIWAFSCVQNMSQTTHLYCQLDSRWLLAADVLYLGFYRTYYFISYHGQIFKTVIVISRLETPAAWKCIHWKTYVKAIAWGVIYIMFFNGISMHFDENRTLATQIGTLGASVGQFTLPVIITASITGYSLKATVIQNLNLYDYES